MYLCVLFSPTLERLRIKSNDPMDTFDHFWSFMSSLKQFSPNITHLHLSVPPGIVEDVDHGVYQAFQNLKVLTLYPHALSSWLLLQLSTLTRLESITQSPKDRGVVFRQLHSNEDMLSEDSLAQISPTGFPALRTLTVTQTVRHLALRLAARPFKDLETLSIDCDYDQNCLEDFSIDALKESFPNVRRLSIWKAQPDDPGDNVLVTHYRLLKVAQLSTLREFTMSGYFRYYVITDDDWEEVAQALPHLRKLWLTSVIRTGMFAEYPDATWVSLAHFVSTFPLIRIHLWHMNAIPELGTILSHAGDSLVPN